MDYDELLDSERELTLRSKLELAQATAVREHQSGEHYSSLFNAAPVGFVVLDGLGYVHEINNRLHEMLELESRQIRMFARWVTRDSSDKFLNHLRESLYATIPVSCELSLRTARGHIIPVELITIALEASSKVLLNTVVIDISSRRKTEERLAKAKTDLQALLDVMPGVLWEADPASMQLTFVSRSAEPLLGYPPNYWYGPDFWLSCIHVDDRERVANLKARAIEQGEGLVLEYRMVRADRQILWVRDAMTVRKIKNRPKIYGLATDITDRKLVEQALQQTRDGLENKVNERTAQLRGTVADLEAFSYSLSHDLRAPLRAMQGYSQLVLKLFGSQISHNGRDYLNRIMTSAERLDHLIQDVLNFSKVARAPLELKPINLEPLLDGIIQDYPSLQQPNAEIEIHKPLLPVCGNEAMLTQSIANLLSNAVKFKRPDEVPRVSVSTEAFDSQVRLCIEDNGIGIAREDQRRIFGIFQRIHSPQQYEGTGIGLAIVKKAAERMGGSVGLESTFGQGSKFWLQLAKPEV